jgi:alkylation response protein AidB-like acyl-CoA dehydrogenase
MHNPHHALGGANMEMETLAKERAAASFDVREMTYRLDGGSAKTKIKEAMALMIERDPILYVKHFFDLTRPEAREKAMAQIRRAVEIRRAFKGEEELVRGFMEVMNSYDRTFSMRMYVHFTLFNESIFTHGTKQQWAQWKDDIEMGRVLGCFAMTELGHSSFLRGLETTATYDKKTQEFVLHSPTLTATKWWIGMAGETATHTVAICRLIVDGRDLGLHWFIVQLRNLDDGTLMPGVTCGDIGAKMGRAGLDNGWIQFTQVRIPLQNMLMKWAQLSPDGQYTASPNPNLAYNTLIGERLVVVGTAGDVLGQTVTIAVRYGAVRRQGGASAGASGEEQQQVLDYQSHQVQLVPILAVAYASTFLGKAIMAQWLHELKNQDQDMGRFLRVLGDYHGLAAGLKAWLGWFTSDCLETIRRTMGGHAYSAYSAIPGHIADHGVITTGGGDNIVLAQQSARYLLGCLRKVLSGKAKGLSGSTAYLVHAQEILGDPTKATFPRSKAKNENDELTDFLNIDKLLEALQWLSIKQLTTVAMHFQAELTTSGKTPDQAWNDNMMELISCSRLHTWYYVIQFFANIVKEEKDSAIKAVLDKLCVALALTRVQAESALFLEFGYLTGAQAALCRKAILHICKEVRKDAVPLVDAFNFPDFILKSPLGCYDGDIYRKYFKMVNDAPQTQTNGRPFYYEKEIKPLLRGGTPARL